MATEVNSFVSRDKLDILATAVADNMPYVRASKQSYPQQDLKGKKFGAKVSEYLTDAGTVTDGIVADPDAVHERQIDAFVQNKNSAVETTFWENFHNIGNREKEIIKKRAEKLARYVEADVINHNVFRGMQAVVAPKVGGVSAPSFEMLSDAATKLAELSVVGDLVDFQAPTIYGKVANSGLAKFIPDDIQKDIFRERYLGQYAGAACVEQALMPKITLSANADTAPTITFTVVKDDNGNIIGYTAGALTASGAGKTLEEGAAYKVPGVYLLDESGVETNQELVLIVHKKITGLLTSTVNGEVVVTKANQGKLAEALGTEDIFVTAKGESFGTPNVWVDPTTFDSGSSTTTVTCAFVDGMGAGKSYWVGQVRTEDALTFDAYTYEDLPGSRRENVGNDGPVVLKAMSFGDGKNGVEMTRIDVSYIATVFEPRRNVVTFTEV
jgi:hypothetical protein